MGATAADIARLRSMTNEPAGQTTFSDAELQAVIERYPLPDPLGIEPYYIDASTTPPTQTLRTSWIPTWDIDAAAADVWEMKAGKVAEDFDSNADGANLSRSQRFDHYTKMASRYRSRRSVRTIKSIAAPTAPLFENNGATVL